MSIISIKLGKRRKQLKMKSQKVTGFICLFCTFLYHSQSTENEFYNFYEQKWTTKQPLSN